MHLGAKVAEIERYFRPIGWGALPLVSNRMGTDPITFDRMGSPSDY